MKNFRKRCNRFFAMVESCRAEAILLADAANIRFVTGVPVENVCVVLFDSKTTVFSDILSYPMLKISAECNEVICNGRSAWVDAILWLRRHQIRRCLIDPMKVPFAFVLAARKIEPGIEWIDAGEQMAGVRALKDRQEIGWITDAVRASLEAMNEWIFSLRTGLTEREAAKFMTRLLVSKTGEHPAFPAMVAFGPNTACPHWSSSNARLKPGDGILVDFGGRVEGYCADLTRVFFWRKASSTQLRRYRAVLDSLETLLRFLKPGTKASAVAEKAGEQMASRRLRCYSVHPPGHGVGLEIHEPPYFCLDSEDKIMINMVIALEPGIFVPGWGGIRLEETVRISASGAVNLANQPVMEKPIL